VAELRCALFAKRLVFDESIKPESQFSPLNLIGHLSGKRQVFEHYRHVAFFGRCLHDPVQSKLLRFCCSRVIRERWHLPIAWKSMEPQPKVSDPGDALALILYPYRNRRDFLARDTRPLIGNFVERKADGFQDPS